MHAEIECLVVGRVQMVMYRDFAKRKARALGLCGTVENLSDGSVRVVAQGSKEQLEKLITQLKRGPLLAAVEEVQTSWRQPTTTFQNFQILYR